MTAIYVATTGNDTTGDGSSENPYATPGKAAAVAIDGDLVWVKSGTYTITTDTPGAAGPVLFGSGVRAKMEGYNTTIGDLGAAPVISAGSVSSISIVKTQGTYGGNAALVRNISVDGNSQADVIGFDLAGSYTVDVAYQCSAANCTTGFKLGTGKAIECSTSGCTTGFNAAVNFSCAIACYASGGTTGFNANAASAIFVDCLANGCSGDGFTTASYQIHWVNCTAYNCGDGFDWGTSYDMDSAFNCVAYGCSGYGFKNQAASNGEAIILGCAAGSCTSGNRRYTPFVDFGVTSLSGDPFVASGSADFRPDNTANEGALLRAAGIGVSGQTNNTDIGAVQHADYTLPAATAVRHGTDRGDGVTGTLATPNSGTPTGTEDATSDACVVSGKNYGAGNARTGTAITGGGGVPGFGGRFSRRM